MLRHLRRALSASLFGFAWPAAVWAADPATLHLSLSANFGGGTGLYPFASSLTFDGDIVGTGGPTGTPPYVMQFSGTSASGTRTIRYADAIDFSRGFTNPQHTGPISGPFSVESIYLEGTAWGPSAESTLLRMALRTISIVGMSDNYLLHVQAPGHLSEDATAFSGFANSATLSITSRFGSPPQAGSASLSWHVVTAPIPEPHTAALAVSGLLAVAAMAGRRRCSAQGDALSSTEHLFGGRKGAA